MSWALISDSSCNLRDWQPTAPHTTFAFAPLKIRVGEREFVDDLTRCRPWDVKARGQTLEPDQESTNGNAENQRPRDNDHPRSTRSKLAQSIQQFGHDRPFVNP